MLRKKLKKPFALSIILAITILLIHVVSALTLDKSIEYKSVPFHSAKVPTELHGYTIAFITDTHAMTAQELEVVVQELNRLQLDLLILGGDFPSSPGAPQRSMAVLSKVVTADGIYGVEGNHDHYVDLFAAMEQYGMIPLSNSGDRVREGFYLAGVEDLWNRHPDIGKATEGAQLDDFILLIAHNPDVTMMQDTTSADLVLSGHTHGGHITFLGIWAPNLTLRNTITGYGQRFMLGWGESGDGVPVYVSKGTGHLAGIPRIFARPEVVLITLYSD
ncbi:MAG: metallophosphoesterase family protein [Clostridia bacterium]|nr:metallophosphoesterase family protein [Clostridia bacterium]